MADSNHTFVRPSSSLINPSGSFVSGYTLGIIYAVIARGTVVLAHHACCHGNFSEVAQQVLRQVRSGTDGKLTYATGEYMYHYICEHGVVYMCITDDTTVALQEFERSKAFLCLEAIRRKFTDAYEGSIESSLPFAMNSEFSGVLAKEMKYYTETAMSLLPQEEKGGLDGIGVRDFALTADATLEQLELLESDTVSMRSYDSLLVQHTAQCTQCCRRNIKALVICLVIGTLIIVIALAVVFGICIDESSNDCGLR